MAMPIENGKAEEALWQVLERYKCRTVFMEGSSSTSRHVTKSGRYVYVDEGLSLAFVSARGPHTVRGQLVVKCPRYDGFTELIDTQPVRVAALRRTIQKVGGGIVNWCVEAGC